MRSTSRGLVIASLLALGGCGPLAHLRSDLKQLDAGLRRGNASFQFSGTQPAVLVFYSPDAAATIEQFYVVQSPGSRDIWLPARPLNAFVFVDTNGDLTYQHGEPCAASQVDLAQTPSDEVTKLAWTLPDAACSERNAPPRLTQADAGKWLQAAALQASFAELATLDDPRFTPGHAKAGMWQPLEFMKSNAAGLFMLQPYDPQRVPVLFVHGILGSPRDFTYLIEHLDKQRFQPWVLSYPSGLALDDLAKGMHGTLARTRYRVGFKELHIVAHSMGGLVSRGYINECSRAADCDYLRSFTTIASPFGGQGVPQTVLDFAPVVAPVWLDMQPGSPYLKSLFATPLPASLPHNLLFTFHHEGRGSTSSDGTIDVVSQLRPEAQLQAATQRGYDETHMGVLANAAVTQQLGELLLKSQSSGGREKSAAL